MGDSGQFFKGTTAEQDGRFKNKEAALLKTMKFPASFDTKVDMRKVELTVMKPWIAKKVTALLGFEDDVLIEYINGLLEDEENRIVDPKKLQLSLTGFLEKKTSDFMVPLWDLLLSAQSSPLKVPAELLEEKKKEMREREAKEAQERAAKERLDDVRNREREERGG
ncbi:PWI domain-containing protein, partial [Meredithblackwellia eburnea MCA 4105]